MYKEFDHDRNIMVEHQGLEEIRCRLWFNGIDDLNSFLKEHCPIKADFNKIGKKMKETKWYDYTTIVKK